MSREMKGTSDFLHDGTGRSQSTHQRRVEEFMKLVGQDLPAKPVIPSLEVRRLRATLILEEALETIKGLGFSVSQPHDCAPLKIQEDGEPDLIEIVDGCADISVVTIGTLSSCGVADAAVLAEVDINNIAKFGPGGYRREDGKWVKPPGHKPPDIAGILLGQGF